MRTKLKELEHVIRQSFRAAFFVCLPLSVHATVVYVGCGLVPWAGAPDTNSCDDGVFRAGGDGMSTFAHSDAVGGHFGQGEALVWSDATLLINFTGGVGAGFYVPCLMDSYSPIGSASGVAVFALRGGKFVEQGLEPAGGTCAHYSDPANQFPLVFGVPLLAHLFLTSEAFFGSASASFSKTFVVLDTSGQVIPGVSWTIEDVTSEVPEPVTAASVFGGLALMFVGCRRFGHRKF